MSLNVITNLASLQLVTHDFDAVLHDDSGLLAVDVDDLNALLKLLIAGKYRAFSIVDEATPKSPLMFFLDADNVVDCEVKWPTLQGAISPILYTITNAVSTATRFVDIMVAMDLAISDLWPTERLLLVSTL